MMKKTVIDWEAMEGCLLLDWSFQEVCDIICVLKGSTNQWLSAVVEDDE